MHIFIYPKKDSTIYSYNETKNTGKDPILEIGKTFLSASSEISSSVSRVLLEFDTNFISQSISNNNITNPKYFLNLRVADSKNIRENNTLYIYAVSESWVDGVGQYSDYPSIDNGVSWKYRDGEVTSSWAISGSTYVSSSELSANIWPTQSLYNSYGNFVYDALDLKIDVSSIVDNWVSGSLNNYGFLIKRSTSEENDNLNYGVLQFYSLNTHTIYSPQIEVKWDDYTFNTGSLTELSASDMIVYANSLESKYSINSRPQIRINSRIKYPLKSYSNTNTFVSNKFLSSSYYSIEDEVTNEVIVPFDDYTKVSTDSNGNFINLRFDGYNADRFYRIKIKYVSGSIQNVYDIGTFKLIK